MSDQERADRLIQLKPSGIWIDPRTISVVQAIAFAKPGTNARASLHIETRAGETHRIPCRDMKEAEQKRDTLAAIANHRGRQVAKKAGVDFSRTPMPGDVGYDPDNPSGIGPNGRA